MAPSTIRTLVLTLILTGILPLLPVSGDEPVDSANLVTVFDDLSPTQSYAYGVDGGTDGTSSVSLPKRAQVQTARVEVDSEVTSDSDVIDYRSDPKKERFNQDGAGYDPTEVDADKNQVRLHRYLGTFRDQFRTWDYIDNASTTANMLLDDSTFDTRLAGGRDEAGPAWVIGPQASSTGNIANEEFFYEGRTFRQVDIDIYSNCGTWAQARARLIVKLYDSDTEAWVEVYNVQHPLFNGMWTNAYLGNYASGKYTGVQVNLSCEQAWGTLTVAFRFTFQIDRFLPSSTYYSKVLDIGTFVPGWQPTYIVNNLTLAADSIIPPGTTAAYNVSTDGGASWEGVTNNTSRVMDAQGSTLRWKVTFTALANSTPYLFDNVFITVQRLLSQEQEYRSVAHARVWPLTAVTPTFNASVPAGSLLHLQLSRDGGTTWITDDGSPTVTSGTTYPLQFDGPEELTMTALQFRAILISQNQLSTPVLWNITFVVEYSMYPTDVIIDFGSDQEVSWGFSGILFPPASPLVIGGDDGANEEALVAELNGLVPHFGVGQTVIFVNVSSTSAGVVRIVALEIGYGLPPEQLNPIPDVDMDEDSSVERVFDLSGFFTDDTPTVPLVFSLTFQEEPSKVGARIEEGRFLSFDTPTANWVGSRRFVVQAVDRDGLKANSNTFTVHVRNVNDDPTIVPLQGQVATVGERWSVQLWVVDPDKDQHVWSVATSPPNSRVTIDSNTGELSLEAVVEDIGLYQVVVTASDGIGTPATAGFSLEVRNRNNVPSVEPIQAQTVSEGVLFLYQVVGSDLDITNGLGDTLTYRVSIANVPPGLEAPPLAIDEQGLLKWQTKLGDLAFGTLEVAVVATDAEGASATQRFLLTVLKENTFPADVAIITPTASGSYREGTAMVFEATATDADKGDLLTFRWKLDGAPFGVGQRFSTTLPAGNHLLELDVDDGHGHVRSAEPVSFKVGPAEKKTIGTDIPTAKNSRQVLGMDLGMFVLLLVGAVTVAVVVGSTLMARLVGSHVRQLKELEREQRGQGGPKEP